MVTNDINAVGKLIKVAINKFYCHKKAAGGYVRQPENCAVYMEKTY
jgi:hypothetical protein